MMKRKPSKLDETWTKLVSLIKQNTVYALNTENNKIQFAYTKWIENIDNRYLYVLTPATDKLFSQFCKEICSKSTYRLFSLDQMRRIAFAEVTDLMNHPWKKANLQNLFKRIEKEKNNKKTYIFAIARSKSDLEDIYKVHNDIRIGKIVDLLRDMKENYGVDDISSEFPDFSKENGLFIEVDVYGKRDHENLNKAIVKGQKIINFINYFAYYVQGDMEPIHLITNLNQLDYSNSYSYIVKSENNEWHISCAGIDHQNIGFVNVNKELIDRVRNLFKRCDKNNFYVKVEQAINWLGKSLIEDNYNDRIMDVMIAFECMAERKVKNVSIVNQLVNFVSYILGTHDKKLFKKKISKYYTLRSKIVHDGFNDVSSEQYWDIFSLVSMLVNELLTNKFYKKEDAIWDEANKNDLNQKE